MAEFFARHQAAIESLFRRHRDFDFLVEFEPLPPGAYADAYFALLEALLPEP
jgi:hypothetical protein